MAVKGESPLVHYFFLKKNIETKIFPKVWNKYYLTAFQDRSFHSYFNLLLTLQLISATLSHPHTPNHCCLLVASEDFELHNIARRGVGGAVELVLFDEEGICCNTKGKVYFLSENVKWPQDILWLIVGLCANSLFRLISSVSI